MFSLVEEENCSNVEDINFDSSEARTSGFPEIIADPAPLEYDIGAKMEYSSFDSVGNGKIETSVDDTGLTPFSPFVDDVKNERSLVSDQSTDKSLDTMVDILGCVSSEIHVNSDDDVEGERI